MSWHLRIDLSAASIPPKTEEGETYIINVQSHGTGRNDYKVGYEKLESTLLTEYLRKIEEPDLNQKLMKLTFDITPADKANSFCKSVLERGVFCRQHTYLFLGHSEEQLKTKSCYLMRATQDEIHKHLAQFGDFLEEKNLGKRARNIGMLFSPLNKVVPLTTKEYKVQPDITCGITTTYTFTDGCGFMSPEFSSEVQRIFELDYHPSAVQVRYRGIEGILVLNEDLADVKMLFHNSMQKFATPDENMLEGLRFVDVVDYSRPYVNGYLDTRMVMLLADRGVSAKNLHELQRGYHELLEDMCRTTAEAEYFLRCKGEFRLLQDIQDKGIDSTTKKYLKGLRKQELYEMEKAAYTRILVPKSRLVFAVCDPYRKLEYGECYFYPTMLEDETEGFIPGQEFVVMQDPCYHPGDVRVLRMTKEKQGYENLRDCLVLPVKGPRPHAFECSGGNLGGNKFLVSWDEKLIPNEITSPCAYPPKRTPGSLKATAFVLSCLFPKTKLSPPWRNRKGRQELLEYFASYEDDLTEKIDATYMKYAAAFGPSSKECRELSKMLYQATDLTQDRVALEKKWLKWQKKEPRAKDEVHSYDTFTLSERRPLVNDPGENNADDEVLLIRQCWPFWRRDRPLCCHANKVRENINKEAEKVFKALAGERKKIV